MSRVAVGAELAGVLSPAVVAEGRFVYVSGQGPLRDGEYVPATIEEETRLTLDNLAGRLAEAGAGLADVVRVGVFLADLGDLPAVNAVYGDLFPSPRPARTTVGVAALPGGIKVEIDCVAVLGGGE